MWRKNVATIIAGGLLAVVLVVYMSSYQVRHSEVAIVKRFGQIKYVAREPGLGLRWPWPIDQVDKFDLRVNMLEDPLSEPLTQGGKPVTAQAFMAWRIQDPELFLKSVGTVNQATAQLRTKLKSVKEAVLGNYSLANFVSTRSEDLKLPEVEQAMTDAMRAWAAAQFGVEVRAVGLKRLGVPESTSTEIFQAMQQGRQELVVRYRGEGEAAAQQIITNADKIAKQIMAFANLRAEQLRYEGIVKAAEQYKEFRKNEEFAIFLKELGVLRQTLGKNTTIVLDWNERPFRFFHEGPSLPPTAGQPAVPGTAALDLPTVLAAPASQPAVMR